MHSLKTQWFKASFRKCALLAGGLLVLLFHGCASTPPPKRIDNICEIFREHSGWYEDAFESYKRWGIPIPVMMAILHQESKYVSDAKPPRTTCLWIFPGPRPSSAYGYAQAKDETWEEYQESTGNSWADRDDFDDAIDFVGWYCNLSSMKCGISKQNARDLYLAYHEGRGGFNRKSYRGKKWLLQVANKVQERANRYQGQLASCEGEFSKGGGCCLWPF
ncbi:MAG: hypothetical protein ABIL06_20290 [Pseudomonadota bacterium]